MKHHVRLSAWTTVGGFLVAVLVADGTTRGVHGASPDSNEELANQNFEPFSTCKKNGPKGSPACYLKFDPALKRYGFHAGAGHGSGTNLVLDKGQQYSVDRCSLAHDTEYWANKGGTTKCDNNIEVRTCFLKVEPRTREELDAKLGFVGAAIVVPPVGGKCWVELPKRADDIRAQGAACGGDGG